MEQKLSELRYTQYNQAITAAQETESNLGSLTYKIHQTSKLRAEIDASLREWWKEVIVEMKLDDKANYMISRDGTIQDVTPPKKEEAPVPAAEAKKPMTIQDLK